MSLQTTAELERHKAKYCRECAEREKEQSTRREMQWESFESGCVISQVDADQMSSSKDVWTRSRREVRAGYVLAPIPQEQETEDMSWNALRAEAKMIGRMLEEGTKVSSEQISNLVKQMTAKENAREQKRMRE